MAFLVTWVPEAENELTRLWLEASDRDRVTLAAAQIDQQLRREPERAGESRDSGRRLLISPPLAVTFRVFDADKLVQVLNVREFRPKGM